MFMCPWSDPYIVKRNMHRKQFLQIFFEFWSKCNSVWRKYFQRMFAQSLHFSELSCVWRTYHTNTLKLIVKDLFQITYFRHGRAILVGTEISCSCASVRIRVLLLGSFELYTKTCLQLGRSAQLFYREICCSELLRGVVLMNLGSIPGQDKNIK